MHANLHRASRWIAMLVLVIQVGCAKAPSGSVSPRPLDAALSTKITELVEQQRFAEAIPLAKELVAWAEKNLGADNTNTVVALCLLAQIYENVPDLTNATSVTERVLAIRAKVLGPDHADTAAALSALAGLYFKGGDYEKAAPLIERSLQIYEKASGPSHPHTLTVIRNLAELYQSAGQYAKAMPHAERSLKLCEQQFGVQDAETAAALITLALVHVGLGEHSQAEVLYLRSLEICEKIFGLAHTNTATILNHLALNYQSMTFYEQAEPLFQRSLEIREKALGPDAPDTAMSLNNLAGNYLKSGDFAKAHPLYQQSLRIREKVLGPDDPDTATSLNNLGLLYLNIGDYAAAEAMFQRSLSISEKVFGPNHPHTAMALDNLAQVHHAQSNAKAEPLYQKCLAIREKALGPKHPDTATSLNNLALLYESFGHYAKAEPLLERCLSICEDALGPDHPQTATALNNWAALCMSMGQLAKAEPLLERSITISERVFGAGHPDTAISLANLCVLKVDQGKFDEALSLERKSRAAAERRWANILSFASEGRRMSYQDSLTIRSANMLGTLGSSADLAESTLRTKGIVLDSLLEDETVARASRRPEAKANLRRLHTASRLLSKLQIEATRDQKPESLRKNHSEQARLQQQVDALQDSLAREVASGGRVRRSMRVSVADVQTALAKDAVLLEFVLYAHYLGSGKSEDRCGAVVIGNGAVTLQGAKAGEPVWIPLATAEAIQRNLLDYSAMMRGGKQGDPAVLRSLYAQLIEPILSRLPASIATLIVSADAELNFVSFATLLDAQEQFLSERYSIRYVSSGRDLLHEPTGQSRSRNYAAFANPAFTEKPTVVAASVTNSVQLTMQSADRRDYGRMILGSLPNTGLEVQFLRDRSSAWHTVGRVHVGAEATELEVKAVKSPYILHLATHGFFLPDSSPTNRPPFQTRLVGEQRRPVAFRNPMQRSGLAFAGAQLTLDAWKRGEVPETENDGILLAQEVGTMDLKDTWLVVLSACDTGIGEARSGEGVMGLRRGFVQAGAQNLLMTLWPISDKWSVEIMKSFYEKAMASGDAPQAMADVQAEWLAKLRKEKGVLIAARIAGPFVLTSRGKPISK